MEAETTGDRPARRRRAGVLITLFRAQQDRVGRGRDSDLARLGALGARGGAGVVQLLPVNEVRGGETSPYSASTAFAIDPVYLASMSARISWRPADGPPCRRPISACSHEVAACPTVDWQRVRSLKARAFRRDVPGVS